MAEDVALVREEYLAFTSPSLPDPYDIQGWHCFLYMTAVLQVSICMDIDVIAAFEGIGVKGNGAAICHIAWTFSGFLCGNGAC